MVRVPEVLNGIQRGLEQSSHVPAGMTYYTRTIDEEGMDAGGTLPDILISEVSTIEDTDRSTRLVGHVRDADGSIIGRIFETGFDMEVQITLSVPYGDSPDVHDLRKSIDTALKQYDTGYRSDLFPDGSGGGIGDIREFTVDRTTPEDDLTSTPSLHGQIFEASVIFVDRLNEVDEFGPLEPIKEVRTPRDGDYEGQLSDDYYIEYHPDTS